MRSLFADAFYILIGLWVYNYAPHFKHVLSDDIKSFLPILAGTFMIGAIVSYIDARLKGNKHYESASLKALKYLPKRIYNLIKHKEQPEIKYQNSFFLMFVKLFFIPLMLQFAYGNFLHLVNHFEHFEYKFMTKNVLSFNFFNFQLYPFFLSLLFFIDTIYYLFGYLIYSSSLNNKIRSVESSLLGWLSALLCYPPLNYMVTEVLPSMQQEYPVIGSTVATFFLRLTMLVLITIYTLSTVNLGWKCSNLTNRGIVSHGMYSVVRHPAYTAKNLFWLISLLPVVFNKPEAVLYMLGWMFIYFLRAYTEEKHLSKDPDYKAYCKKVKYRFIPKII